MQSLILGLLAALCWGFHDFLVRRVTQHSNVAPLLFVVFLAGAIVLAPVTLIGDSWAKMGPVAIRAAIATGAAYVLASVALYRAFEIGPVRLVAPIMGAYPVISATWAAVQGQALTALQWLAVLAVVGGIALVARQPGTVATDRRSAAIGWAIAAGIGFALTFALGQMSVAAGAELPATFVARGVAVMLVGGYLVITKASLAPARPYLGILLGMGCLDVMAISLVMSAGTLPHPEFAAVAASLFGMITILLAWALLKERIAPAQWLGVLIVFAGIGILAV